MTVVDTWAMRGARAVLVFKGAIDLTSDQTNLIEPAGDDEQNICNYPLVTFLFFTLASDPQIHTYNWSESVQPLIMSHACLICIFSFTHLSSPIHPNQSCQMSK